MNYFIRIQGKTFGPFGLKEMLQLKQRGKLKAYHEVSLDQIEWSAAEIFSELFPEEMPEGGRDVDPIPDTDPPTLPGRNKPEEPPSPKNRKYALASPGIRLGAHILDSLMFFFAIIPGLAFLLIFALGAANSSSNGRDIDDKTVFVFVLISYFLIGFFLLILGIVNLIYLCKDGQTLGKKFTGIKIVNYQDNSNPGFVSAFLLRSFVNGLIIGVPFVGWIYYLVDVFFIFGKENRCIHDLLANTKVVVCK